MAELEGQMEEMQKRHESNLRGMTADHDSQMERVHQRVAEAHETYSMVKRGLNIISVRVKDLLNLKQDMRI